jgi:GntR family transcriptional regulator/MocR family aminotransferase
MSKRATPLKKPEIMLDQNASPPLYRQLYERLRGSILSGQLEAGTRLPSTRVLASSLGVSRTTTALAYEQLLLEGFIESRVGDGTWVARLQPEQVFQGSRNVQDLDATDTSGTPPAVLARRGAANCSSICRIQKNSTRMRQVAEQACSSLASQM